MKPEAFLPSNSPGPSSASTVPATPKATGPVAGARPAPKAGLSLAQRIERLDKFLRDNRSAPRAQRLEFIELRHKLKLEQEAAEQQANPVVEVDLRRASERLARKAQSGFAGPPTAGDLDSSG